MHPIILSPVPGSPLIVAAPVIADAEGHNADTQTRAELDDGYPAVLIVVVQVIAVDPAAVAFPVHIAPGPIIETAIQRQQTVRRYGHDQRVIRTGTGAQMHGTLGIGVAGPGRRTNKDCCKAKKREGQTFHDRLTWLCRCTPKCEPISPRPQCRCDSGAFSTPVQPHHQIRLTMTQSELLGELAGIGAAAREVDRLIE